MSTARRAGAVLLSAAAVLLAVTGCSSSNASSGGKLSLVAYSVPKPAYEALQKAFAATEQGKGTTLGLVLRSQRHPEPGGRQRPGRRLRGVLPRAGPDQAGAESSSMPAGTPVPPRGWCRSRWW